MWWLRFAEIEDGAIRPIVRDSKETCVYTPVTCNSVKGAIEVLALQKNSITVQKVLEKCFLNNSRKVSFSECFVKGGDTPKGKVPDLSEYLPAFWDKALTQEALFMTTPVVKFTNDPTIPAMCCVNIENITNKGNIPSPPTPTIDAWLNNLMGFNQDKVKVFRAYFHGILRADFKSRQGIYVEETDGNTGKTTFMKIYQKVVNNFGRNIFGVFDSGKLVNNFTLANIYGKRIVIDSDVKNSHILQSQNYHKITGGDTVTIERKGEQGFSGSIKAFPVMFGNISLELNTAFKHETSRIVYLKATKLSDTYLKTQCVLDEKGELKRDRNDNISFSSNNNFEANLESEMMNWIKNSERAYNELCDGGNLMIPDEVLEDLENLASSANQQIFEDLCHNVFDFGEDLKQPTGSLILDINDVLLEIGNRSLIEGFKSLNLDRNSLIVGEFHKYLHIKHNINKKKIRLNSKTNPTACLVGMRVKKGI